MKFTFDSRLKQGYYSACYFNKATHIVKKYRPNDVVCMQFMHFDNQIIKVCGINESVQLLKSCLTPSQLKNLKIYGRKDGDLVKGKTPVLLIFGYYQDFGYLENVIDGILARRSSTCNNCSQMLKLIKSKQLIYMADRTDDYLIQPYDGYAAYVAGVRNFVTDASVELFKSDKNIKVTGTIPHALIQLYDGNLNNAMKDYINEYGSANSIALIDYHNDVGSEIKKLSEQFHNIFAVRIDTSSNMIDKGINRLKNDKTAYGVS
jgi:nicotinate phosphoribosyltransferase